MSDAPTSAPDLKALIFAGWREEELAWERLQERGLAHAAAGEAGQAAACWAEALRLARAQFAPNDPRLAASLGNHAVALRRAGDGVPARGLLEEALLVWDSAEPWVAALEPERRARSSTFHLRLQSKHPGGYDHFSKARYAALVEEGRAVTRALAAGGGSDAAEARLARWRKEKPEGFTDARKLIAAARLIAGG